MKRSLVVAPLCRVLIALSSLFALCFPAFAGSYEMIPDDPNGVRNPSGGYAIQSLFRFFSTTSPTMVATATAPVPVVATPAKAANPNWSAQSPESFAGSRIIRASRSRKA